MKENNENIRSRYKKKQKRYKFFKYAKIYLAILSIIVLVIYFKNRSYIKTIEEKHIDYTNSQEKIEKDLTDNGGVESIEDDLIPSTDDIVIENMEQDELTEVDIIDEKEQYLEQFEGLEQASEVYDWKLMLVNKKNSIPENFEVELESIGNGHSVDKRIKADLENMIKDANSQNIYPLICASYRTVEKQTTLYKNKVSYYMGFGITRQEAEEKASYWVAIPNTSEHQIGLALDIIDSSYQKLDSNQENTKVQKWLMENSYKYGFILRYPNDKKDITMINYEPWHYRYVGVENAKIIHDKNLCLEEFVDLLSLYNNFNY